MILIYTHKVTPRVRYIFKHIFTRILQITINFTSKIEEFVAYNGPKFSYTNVPLGKEFFIQSNELLFQQGVKDVEITIQKWDGVPCFFATIEASEIPFDIFAASFFLISRYEEYMPHIKDKHGRFAATNSIAYQNGFLEKPLVDVWAFKFLETLQQKFPDFDCPQRNYQYISTIDVDNAYAYKYKSFVRTIGGFLKDASQFKIFTMWDRFAVLFNFKKDPFDTFQKAIELQKAYKIKTIFFF
ncbi:hypothetical protein P8625_15285 [Tenacibaculum tangerinum]|uniref:DUF7033 domain-containing protein n=1 Tax=Tenacibaculum tangerinum TaxID=3038772 RepID=A0ABY8L1U1_9FLAO|nr:hypothetical protein [Tenacibaculum tangerinum]WGH75413.1 hypothetical protein P8625_15285 [Tenacibaculum tangerinum]